MNWLKIMKIKFFHYKSKFLIIKNQKLFLKNKKKFYKLINLNKLLVNYKKWEKYIYLINKVNIIPLIIIIVRFKNWINKYWIRIKNKL